MSSERLRSRRELVADLIGASGDGRRRLLGLLAAERVAVDVYGRAASATAVTPAGRLLATNIEAQERAHVRVLGRLLGSDGPLGSALPVGAAERELGRLGVAVQLGALGGEQAYFGLLESLENALQGSYYDALAGIDDPALATLVARIMAKEAEHSTLLYRFRSPGHIELEVPDPFVEGSAGEG